MTYENIPQELRALIQFCVWRYEKPEESENITKVPYNPITGRHTSVTDPQSWCSFEQATEAAKDWNKWAGIGFIFSSRDPYCGIDLDNPLAKNVDGSPKFSPEKQAEIWARQQFIFEQFVSYAERSPSGNGLHIIVKASVPRGCKRDSVEIYSNARFFTMTGNVYRDAPIAEYNDLANKLWDEMAPAEIVGNGFIADIAERNNDNEVCLMAERAENGQKFISLYNGNWQTYYSSQSEADFALIDIISFYTQNISQIIRIFRESALGRRDKAKRDSYVGDMVQRSFDNQPPHMNIDGITKTFDDYIAKQKAPKLPAPKAKSESMDIDKNYWLKHRPPGLMNMIIDYALASSPRPVYEMALTAAIGLMAGITGRQYNVSSTGLNQYLMLIADTGKGKEAIAGTINDIVNAVAKRQPASMNIIGPSDFGSGQGLLRYLSAMPSACAVSLIGEFGVRLKSITADSANATELMLRKVLLDLYMKSGAGQSLNPVVYSDKKNNVEAIQSPALTIIGESTKELFYEALGEDTVSSGLLPRFLIIEYNGPRTKMNYNHVNVSVPENLIQLLDALVLDIAELADKQIVYEIKLDANAQAYSERLNDYCDDMINSANQDIIRQVYNRVHLKTLKLAGILAVSYNSKYPQVSRDMMQWAASLVVTDTERLIDKFDRGEMGNVNETEAQINEIKRQIKFYLSDDATQLKTVDARLWNAKIISRSWILRRVFKHKSFKANRNVTLTLKNIIDMMIADGNLVRVANADLEKITNKIGFHIAVADYDWLNSD